MNLDMQKLEPLLGKVVNEMGAASNGALVILGDKLGLFRALAQGAMTSVELAAATRRGTNNGARVGFSCRLVEKRPGAHSVSNTP